jgi:hypothetical protein
MYLPLLAAKSRKLDAVLVVEAFFLAHRARIGSLPLDGDLFLASPFFAAVAKLAPRTNTLLPIIAPAPLAPLPTLPALKQAVQVLLKLQGGD